MDDENDDEILLTFGVEVGGPDAGLPALQPGVRHRSRLCHQAAAEEQRQKLDDDQESQRGDHHDRCRLICADVAAQVGDLQRDAHVLLFLQLGRLP